MVLALDLDYFAKLWEPWRELERVIVVSRAILGARGQRASHGASWSPGRSARHSKLD